MSRVCTGWASGIGLALAIAASFVGGAAAEVAESAPVRTSTAELVRSDLEAFIRARVEGEPVSIEIPELRAFDFDASGAPGAVRTELSSLSPTPMQGRVAITVSLFVGQHLVKRGVVSPYVAMNDRVVVARRALTKGRVVTSEDLDFADRDRAHSPGDVVRDLDAIVGQRARRSLGAAQVLREGDFERVPVVERGDRVTLVLKHGPLLIQTLGKAQETGATGDWIRVVNVESKREVSGRVDAEGRVHVAF
ncbi:MAG: flagellar basal body P-ring formation chaperone FlgA [Myxococcota bacterium]